MTSRRSSRSRAVTTLRDSGDGPLGDWEPDGVRLAACDDGELIRFAGKHTDNRILMALLAPGLWLQRLTTREPTLDQIEVSIRALQEVLRAEGRLSAEERKVEVMA